MLRLDIPITKVDAPRRLVYGLATAEVADRAGEICDYASTKPLYEAWSQTIAASSGGRSYGNLRAMHGPVAAGKVVAITFNDAARQIEICAKVVDDAEWDKVAEGVYTGFSQGGTYARRWTDEAGATRYTADPHEISLVDLPCLAQARFEMIKADGSHEWRRFTGAQPEAGVEKAGARNSAADAERIQTIHDTAAALGATCPARQTPGTLDDLDRLLTRHFAGSPSAKGVSQATLAALADTLAKGVRDALGQDLADLSARLARIEAQPLPLPLAPGLRAVGRNEGGRDEGGDALLDDPATLSLLAIKLAQRQPR